MKLLLRSVFFAVLIAGVNGCYYDKESELYPNSVCDDANVTFSATISPMITSNCARSGCHVAGFQTPYFTDYNSIYNSRDRIKVRAVVQKDMPKGGPLSPCDIKKLQKWLDNGAPNN